MEQQKLIIALSAVVLPAGIATAAPPVGYDGWTASSGTIDTSLSCTGGVTCDVIAADDGFVQEKIVVDDYEYIRLIVTDKYADGNPEDQPFTSEAYVPFAVGGKGISQGVASKHVVRDFAEGFVDQAEVQRSMMRFRDPGMHFGSDTELSEDTPAEEMFSIRLTQTFDTPEFKSSFQYTNYTEMVSTFPAGDPDTNDVIGYIMNISQEVALNPGGIIADVDPDASQGFVHRQISGFSGNYPNAPFWVAFSKYFSGDTLTPPGSMTLDGTTVSWGEEDTVSTNWLVQTSIFDADDIAINYQDVTNHETDDTASEMQLTGEAPASPFDWDDPTFGTEPEFPFP